MLRNYGTKLIGIDTEYGKLIVLVSLLDTRWYCFPNASAALTQSNGGVVPYRKRSAGSPAPSPQLSAFFSVSSLK